MATVAGSDRYDTAARIAQSLGTAPAPNGDLTCTDPDTTDGSTRQPFYANAVVELRASATSCRLLSRTVVLADGVTGADALAAGWWTSFWQVPVLLHDGDGSLPQATVDALLTMAVSNVIVLGGTARISDEVATEAKNLSGAGELVRVAGTDRYDTSVQMAQQLGGWWPTGDAADFDSSMVCLAASGGNGPTATGWPDALGAGPFCGAIGGAASNPGVPARALPAPSGASPTASAAVSLRPAHDAVPILLVPTGSRSLPATVATLLSGAFPSTGRWCNSSFSQAGCSWPGFAIGFGGDAALTQALVASASLIVGGGSGQLGSVPPTEAVAPFFTDLDMAPVFDQTTSGSARVCALRGTYNDARWLAVYSDTQGQRAVDAIDIMMRGRYLTDADLIGRTPFIGTPSSAISSRAARSLSTTLPMNCTSSSAANCGSRRCTSRTACNSPAGRVTRYTVPANVRRRRSVGGLLSVAGKSLGSYPLEIATTCSGRRNAKRCSSEVRYSSVAIVTMSARRSTAASSRSPNQRDRRLRVISICSRMRRHSSR